MTTAQVTGCLFAWAIVCAVFFIYFDDGGDC